MADHISVSQISNYIGQDVVLKGWVWHKSLVCNASSNGGAAENVIELQMNLSLDHQPTSYWGKSIAIA